MKTKRIGRSIALLFALFCVAVCFTGCKEKAGDERSVYRLSAQVNAETMTVDATCDITYVNRTDVELGEVWFHLYPAAYRDGARYTPVSAADQTNAYPAGVSYGGIEIREVKGGEYEIVGKDEDVLAVKLGSTLLPTQSVKISVAYTLTLPRMRHRLGYENGNINLGNWFPVECAYESGFVDSPYYADGDPFNLPVCDYEAEITAPKDYIVAMSGKTERTENEESATTRCRIEKARDFAAVLGKFTVLSQTVGGVDVNYYYTSDENAQAHLGAACDALTYFSREFGAYPYRAYSVVQTPFNQGGMEYSGLVYVSDAAQGDMITEIIVHETAHQWWYGIVGNDQINHAWLDESLAEYSTTLFYKANPSYGVKYEDRIADAMGGFSLYCELSKCTDTSMDRAIPEFASTQEYTYMTYVKGQLLYDSLCKTLGEKTFFAALREYATRCAYTTARPDDLIACFDRAAKRDMKPFFNSFLDGTAKLYGMN